MKLEKVASKFTRELCVELKKHSMKYVIGTFSGVRVIKMMINKKCYFFNGLNRMCLNVILLKAFVLSYII